jgi:hypothetical protein
MEILITLAFEFVGDTGLSREVAGTASNTLFTKSTNITIINWIV